MRRLKPLPRLALVWIGTGSKRVRGRVLDKRHGLYLVERPGWITLAWYSRGALCLRRGAR